MSPTTTATLTTPQRDVEREQCLHAEARPDVLSNHAVSRVRQHVQVREFSHVVVHQRDIRRLEHRAITPPVSGIPLGSYEPTSHSCLSVQQYDSVWNYAEMTLRGL